MNKLIIIAAVGKNNELGYLNGLIWTIKEDMKFFKEHTINHHILMGKNTFNSLPSMLKDRTHIVLTSDGSNLPEEVKVINSKEEFNIIKDSINDDIYVIGGASIYKQFIDDSDEILLTEIDDTFSDADCYFPDFRKSDYNKEILEEYNDDNPSYKHVLYKKRKR